MLYDFTHMWNRKQQRKKTLQKQILRYENKLVVTRRVGHWRIGKKGEGSQKVKVW